MVKTRNLNVIAGKGVNDMRQFRDTKYYITDDGQVLHKRTNGYRKVICGIGRDGYNKVGLFKNGVRTFYRVHRLVAECYIENPNNYKQVNHINGIKTDNRVSNLEWVSQSQNMIHAYQTGLIPSGEEHHKSKLTNEQVDWIRNYYIYKHPKFGSTSLGKKFNVCHGTILRIVKNQTHAQK